MVGHQVRELNYLYEGVSDYGKTAAFSGLLQFIVRNPYLAPFNAATRQHLCGHGPRLG